MLSHRPPHAQFSFSESLCGRERTAKKKLNRNMICHYSTPFSPLAPLCDESEQVPIVRGEIKLALNTLML